MNLPPVPGTTILPVARRVLVLAPHADDETLGCGGLVARLAAGGATVRVLYLTDSGGVLPDAAERATLAARRRDEAAAAVAVLGLSIAGQLAIPDGELAKRCHEAATAIRAALAAELPDLVLVPSPLERSADHRGAFAALHAALAPLRDPDPLRSALDGAAIWVYEVNQPAFPDVLVDVSTEVTRIERAMACHASQEAEHPFLAAGLGLRRFRCHTLLPDVTAAEGYRRLTLDDFRTRGLAALVAKLGGAIERGESTEGPLVSVVVRTRDRPELLAEALASLAASTYRRLELVLVNDGGAAPSVPEGFPFPVVGVDSGGRGRAAAANAGIAAASGAWVGFLDDDDRVEPEHYATLVGAASAPGVRLPYADAAVVVHELGAGGWTEVERRLPYSRDFDPELLLVDNYIPFHTPLLPRELLTEVGPLDESFPFFEDWDLLVRLARLVPFHHVRQVTCEYRVFRGGAHHVFGEAPRARADFLLVKSRFLAKHADLLTPERLAGAVDRLRADAVVAGEETSRVRRELAEVRAAAVRDRESMTRLDAEARRLHAEERRLNGDLLRLEGAFEALHREASNARETLAATQSSWRAEAVAAAARERELAGALGAESARLAATYAEIERLGRLIAAMEGTRAWRVHRAVERLKGRGAAPVHE